MNFFLLFPIIFLLISEPQVCHINILIFIFSPKYQQICTILGTLCKYTYMQESWGQIYHKANEVPSLA